MVIDVLLDSITDTITLAATYTTTVLTSPAASCMLGQLDDILAYMIAHPSAPYLSVYTAIRPSLQSWQNPQPALLPTPAGPLLHSWFEHHARATPNALALWFKYTLDPHEAGRTDVRWTYEELNARANRMARVLRKVLGEIGDEPIAICMEKSPGLYLSMLAILKVCAAVNPYAM